VAEDQDDASKTEEPSQRKLQRAREQGQVTSSQEIKHWGILIAATIAIATIVPWTAGEVASFNKRVLEHSHEVSTDLFNLRDFFTEILFELLLVLSPFLGVMILAAIATSMIQSGLIWAPSKIQPKLNNISVIKGFGRLVSMRSVIELVKGAAKLILIAFITALIVMPWFDDVDLIPFASVADIVDRLFEITLLVFVASIIVMTVVSFIDYMYQRYTFIKQQRMTKQEVKDEHKQAEGDPQVKARIRQLRAERGRQRMMAAVPEADVVVTNPTHFAVALSYKMEEMGAPVVVAKGQDHIALKIREIAEENDVPIYEAPPLARTLYAACEIDQEIPTEHYQAVAEVIGFVMRLKNQGGGQGGGQRGGQQGQPIN